VQPPRLNLGLILFSPLVFALLTPPNLSAETPAAAKSAAAKKASTENGGAKSAGNAKLSGTAAGKPAAKGASKQAQTTAKAPAKGAARASSKGGTRTASKAAPKRSQKTVYRQLQPEPERIRDIQQSLLDHGYPLEVNGVWDAPTVEALKKFQTDQRIENLSGKGKLDSMTLIALGLGPKREPPSGQTEEPKQTPEGKLP